MRISGWKLDRTERERLLAEHPPRYAKAVADHVTLKPFNLAPHEVKASIVGRIDDESGVEAMVVAIDGSVDRPDGSIYHITWSLADGRDARESNDVLKERGWKELDHPIPVTLTPARF
ncbi:hypothetical protein M8312_07080 [Sphingomonas sp. KRR8]|uniref:hypothetical protein n=1 Tax=Sphingomonas sp. KRR8 TaxID=2942996 RepID=UPI0020213898|nr:hypothetical protein [Sphingomonas sp. KRR8]URD62253.1 hypothetical protein M8312_07080 [Sphingomonas sp. KRR8]